MAVMYPTPLKIGDHANSMINLTGASAIALPLNSAGDRPKYVFVMGTSAGIIAFGNSGMAPASDTQGIRVNANVNGFVMDVSGYTHGRTDGTGQARITALENDGGVG